MAYSVECPFCKSMFQSEQDCGGQSVNCPVCGKNFICMVTLEDPGVQLMPPTPAAPRYQPPAAYPQNNAYGYQPAMQQPVTYPPQGYQTPAPQPGVYGAQGYNAAQPPVENHLVGAIVVTVLGFGSILGLILGIVAVVNALQVEPRLAIGDIAGAQRASKTADSCIKICIVLLIVATLIWIIVSLLLFHNA